MFMIKHVFYSMALTFLGIEVFDPMSGYPLTILIAGFLGALYLFLDNSIHWYWATRKPHRGQHDC